MGMFSQCNTDMEPHRGHNKVQKLGASDTHKKKISIKASSLRDKLKKGKE